MRCNMCMTNSGERPSDKLLHGNVAQQSTNKSTQWPSQTQRAVGQPGLLTPYGACLDQAWVCDPQRRLAALYLLLMPRPTHTSQHSHTQGGYLHRHLISLCCMSTLSSSRQVLLLPSTWELPCPGSNTATHAALIDRLTCGALGEASGGMREGGGQRASGWRRRRCGAVRG